MSVFRYPIEEPIAKYFFIKISIPVNQKRYKEALGDTLSGEASNKSKRGSK